MEQPVESLSRLLVREVFAAIQGLLAKLNRFNETGFFREIPADSLLRERICVTASMGGKFGKLVLLFRSEVYFHISQSRGVIPACQRAARGAGVLRMSA
jgi:hypothetical protein